MERRVDRDAGLPARGKIQQAELHDARFVAIGEIGQAAPLRRPFRRHIDIGAGGDHLQLAAIDVHQADTLGQRPFQGLGEDAAAGDGGAVGR